MIDNYFLKYLVLVIVGSSILFTVDFIISKLAKKIVKVDASTWAQAQMYTYYKGKHVGNILGFILFGAGTIILMITMIQLLDFAYLAFLPVVCTVIAWPGGKYIGLPKNPRTLNGRMIQSVTGSISFFIVGVAIFFLFKIFM
jgi:hypothetical protein